MSGTVLDRICGETRKHVADQKRRLPLHELISRLKGLPAARGFAAVLEAKVKASGVAVIAEIKKASPTAGVIRSDFNPGRLARAYGRGGAACLSVLTDHRFFQGSEADLGAARTECPLPILRKDFMIDPYQILESRAVGADCVLLIVAALTDEELQNMERLATENGLDVLVEVHSEAELERALKLKTPLIGINNRNLGTLQVDLATTERLAPLVPKDRQVVCESGIHTGDEMRRMMAVGVQRFLVGESLMRQQDVETALRKLLVVAEC